MNERVLVGEKEFRKGEAVFSKTEGIEFVPAPTEEEALAAMVRRERVRAVIVGMTPYRGALYEALAEVAAGRGALIARFGVGHENIDKALARAHGCVVCNTPGVLDASVAEHTMWLLGSFVRGVACADATTRQGEWTAAPGIELAGKRLGLIGFGRIAQKVAAMAHHGFGMRVRAVGTSSPAEWSGRHGENLAEVLGACGVEHYGTDAEALLAECDFVSLHLPGSAANRHFLNAERLGRMKPTAVLINTARGNVVDEAALYDALAEKRLGGAALDVFENEPYRPVAEGKDLRTLPNVLLTPHVGSNTAEANRRMAEKCVENVRGFFRGELERVTVVRE